MTDAAGNLLSVANLPLNGPAFILDNLTPEHFAEALAGWMRNGRCRRRLRPGLDRLQRGGHRDACRRCRLRHRPRVSGSTRHRLARRLHLAPVPGWRPWRSCWTVSAVASWTPVRDREPRRQPPGHAGHQHRRRVLCGPPRKAGRAGDEPRRHRTRPAQRATADDPEARADRLHLPGLQPDAVAHRHAEHRPAAAPRRSPSAARGCPRGRRAGRARPAPPPPPGAALRRPAAARRDRQGARHPARGRLRRRAHRGARHPHRARRARAPA